MTDTQKVTVHFSGSVTYDAASQNCEGRPWLDFGRSHHTFMADLIAEAINDGVPYSEEDREPTDYVQEIHDVTVNGIRSEVSPATEGNDGESSELKEAEEGS